MHLAFETYKYSDSSVCSLVQVSRVGLIAVLCSYGVTRLPEQASRLHLKAFSKLPYVSDYLSSSA